MKDDAEPAMKRSAGFSNVRELVVCTLKLRRYMAGSRHLAVATVVTMTVAAAFEGVGVGLLVPLLSLMLGGGDPASRRMVEWLSHYLPGREPQFYVVLLCFLIVGAIALKNALLHGSNLLSAALRRAVVVQARDALFSRLHRSDLQVFETQPAGDLANVFLTETVRVKQLIEALLLLLQKITLGILYLVALTVLSWPLMLVTMVIAAIIGGTIVFAYRHLVRSGQEIIELHQRLSSTLVESFSGVRVIRATASENDVLARFHKLNDSQARLEEASTRSASVVGPIAETVAVAGAIVMVAGAYVFMVRPGTMSQSVLFTFGFVLLRLLPLVNQLYTIQGFAFHMLGSVRELDRWMETPLHPVRPFGSGTFPSEQESIHVDRVSYVYPNGHRALHEVSLHLPAGQTVALVGSSGSGKSTLAALLLRLREPTGGRITVGGRDYWTFAPESWHRSVAVVEQEAFLFHDTMARNVAFGLPDVSRERVEEAVRLAYLEDVVAALPKGLETIVGERGASLSGGQRQRLAIARALVRDPSVLILDEATSALDSISERKVQAALDNAREGRTVLVIAHRLSTIRNADRIVVLAGGEVVEDGTWEELSIRSGAFSELLEASVSAA